MPDRPSSSRASDPTTRGGLYYLSIFCAVGAYMPFLNVYFSHLGLSGRQIGLIATFAPMMTLTLAPPLSAYADRKRRRLPILRTALSGGALLLPLLGIPRSFAALVALSGLMSVFFSPVMAIADSLIARMAVRHQLNYGSMRLWGSIGFSASSIGFGLLWQKTGFGPMFMTASVLILPVIHFAGQLEEGPPVPKQDHRSVSELVRDPGLVALLMTAFLVGISVTSAINFEGIYMEHLGGDESLIGLLIGISAASELPTMRYSGAIGRRLQGPKTLLLAYGLMGSAFAGYAFATAPHTLLLLATAKGLGFGLFFPSTVRLLTERAPERWSATAQALMTASMFGLAPLVAGPLGGLIHDTVGPAAIFAVDAISVGLAAAVIALSAIKGTLD